LLKTSFLIRPDALRRINCAQPSRSFFRLAANSAGLSNTGISICWASRSATVVARMAAAISLAMRRTIGAGVPAGATTLKETNTSSGNEASESVGVGKHELDLPAEQVGIGRTR